MIVAFVEENRSVTVQQLMEILDASESTIRRDLNALDQAGRLVKVYGGAVARDMTFDAHDDEVGFRKEQNREAKIAIARYAATLIEPDDFVFLDAGTTTELMIDHITERRAVFVTNAVLHAKKLSQAGFQTYILGGEFKAATEAIVGEEAVLGLEKYNFTKGFWGSNGVSLSQGFSTPDVKEAMIKKTAMHRCMERYVLCDSTKFAKTSCVSFAAFTDATILTDQVPPERYKAYSNICVVGK